MATYDTLKEAIMVGDDNVVEAQVNKALGEGSEAQDIMNNGLIAGMEVVGKRFKAGEMFLPEVLLSAEVMHKGLDIVNPLLAKAGHKGPELFLVTLDLDPKTIVGFDHSEFVNDSFHRFTSILYRLLFRLCPA